MKRSVNVKKLKKIFTGFIVFALFLGCTVFPSFTSHAAETSTFTIDVPVSNDLKVVSNGKTYFATSVGTFVVEMVSQSRFSVDYVASLDNLLPRYMLQDYIRPLNIEWGFSFYVTDQIGMDLGDPGTSKMNPVFQSAVQNGSLISNNNYYTISDGSSVSGRYNLSPNFVQYIQGGNVRDSSDIYNEPYDYSTRFSAPVSLTSFPSDSSLHIFLGYFLGDTDASNQLVFRVNRFYITFTYVNSSISGSVDGMVGGVGDFNDSADNIEDAESSVFTAIRDAIDNLFSMREEDPLSFSSFLDFFQLPSYFVFNVIFYDLLVYDPLAMFIILGLGFLCITFLFKFI